MKELIKCRPLLHTSSLIRGCLKIFRDGEEKKIMIQHNMEHVIKHLIKSMTWKTFDVNKIGYGIL